MLDEPQRKTGTEVPVCLRSCVCVHACPDQGERFFIVDETLCVHWDANWAEIARKLVHHAPIEPIGECIEAERSGKRARKDVARID
jgi:hypothetical protein